MSEEVQLGGGVTLPSQLAKILDTPKDSRLLDAPSNYVVVNDSDMLGTTIVENSCIILFDWNTFINKIIGIDDQSALKKDFIIAIESILGNLNIQSSVNEYEKVLNREINKSLLDFRVTLGTTLGGSSASFSIENFSEQWVVNDPALRGNSFYGQSIIQEGIRFVIEAKGRFTNPTTNERDFYRIFTGFIETINETNNPLDKKLSYTATDMSYLLSATRFNITPAIHEKDPIANQKEPVVFRNVLESKSTEQIFKAIFSEEQVDKTEIQRPFYWKIETGKGASIGFNSDNLGLVEEDYRRNWHVKRSSTQIKDYAFGSSQDKPFNPMVLLWGHTGLAYAEVFGTLKLFISAFKTRQDILTDLANIVFFKTYVDGAGNVHFHPPRFEEEAYLQLRDGYALTEEKEHPLSYTVFDDDTISQSYSQSSKEICTVARGHGEGGYGIYEAMRKDIEPNYLKASIAWPDGINRFGFKEGNISTSAVGSNENLLNAFTAAFLIRRNQERFNMAATMIMRPELQVDRPIYDYNKDKVYYIRSVTHTYSAGTPTSGGTYTTSISCNAGRRIGEKISSNIFATAKSLKKTSFEDAIKNYADSYNLQDYRTIKSPVRK